MDSRLFLKDRPQHVRVNGFKSSNIVLNTGVPPGAVLLPILFSIYTNKTTCDTRLSLFKYADDMALVACLTERCHHGPQVPGEPPGTEHQ